MATRDATTDAPRSERGHPPSGVCGRVATATKCPSTPRPATEPEWRFFPSRSVTKRSPRSERARLLLTTVDEFRWEACGRMPIAARASRHGHAAHRGSTGDGTRIAHTDGAERLSPSCTDRQPRCTSVHHAVESAPRPARCPERSRFPERARPVSKPGGPRRTPRAPPRSSVQAVELAASARRR